MNEFISVYHLVLGTRQAKEDVSNEKVMEDKFEMHDVISPTGVELVASAIDEGDIYHYDAFARFSKADGQATCRIKNALAVYGELLLMGSPYEMNDFMYELHDKTNTLDWHRFGWLKEDLPDFEALHEQWKKRQGMGGKNVPSIKVPAQQCHFWPLVGGLLKAVVGDDPYEAAVQGKYILAVSALEAKGFRWSDNEKPALRRNLNRIVSNA
tara:strand:- start:368 stop:1000 length:633 start_codon:yes stop_codon:yes gene_type:complete